MYVVACTTDRTDVDACLFGGVGLLKVEERNVVGVEDDQRLGWKLFRAEGRYGTGQ